jgi:hypothetical protein
MRDPPRDDLIKFPLGATFPRMAQRGRARPDGDELINQIT